MIGVKPRIRAFVLVSTAIVLLIGGGLVEATGKIHATYAPTYQTESSCWLSGWLYRKAHVIIGSQAGAQSNYPVKIIVHFGDGVDSGAYVYLNHKCRADFGDIRFTQTDGETLFDYYLQEYVPSERAVFWVEITELSISESTIYLYYGNGDENTLSSGPDTFVFFDDFANLNSWNVQSGVWQIEDNTAKCVQAGVLSHAISHSDGAILYRAKVSRAEDYWRAIVLYRWDCVDVAFRSGWGYHSGLGGKMIFIDNAFHSGWWAIASNPKDWDTNSWYVAEARFAGGTHQFELDGDGSQIEAGGFSSPSAGSHIGISRDDLGNQDYPVWFDWFAFRKYVDPEPTHGVWSPEEISNPTAIYINPPVALAGLNQSFTVDVEVANVTDLYSWELKLYYLNAILNATSVQEGPFLKSAGYTLWMDNSNPNYNATHGLIYVGASLTGEIPGVNGSGVITTITFRGLAKGSSPLDLQNTILLDCFVNDIPHSTSGGSVTVGKHDVAVLSIMPDKNVVGNSTLCAMSVNVTVQNHGDFNESFSVTLCANTTAINSTMVSLDISQGATLRFVWRPAEVPKGNYTLGANASVVPGEVDVANNTLYNDTVIAVAMAGDIAGLGTWPDGAVNIKDSSLLASTWGSNQGELRYRPNCDINDDGKINIRDIAILARNWGKIDP